MRQISRTVVAGGVIGGKHTGGVVQWWSSIRPVDLLCLGPNDVFGCPIVVRNNLHTHTHTHRRKRFSYCVTTAREQTLLFHRVCFQQGRIFMRVRGVSAEWHSLPCGLFLFNTTHLHVLERANSCRNIFQRDFFFIIFFFMQVFILRLIIVRAWRRLIISRAWRGYWKRNLQPWGRGRWNLPLNSQRKRAIIAL